MIKITGGGKASERIQKEEGVKSSVLTAGARLLPSMSDSETHYHPAGFLVGFS